MGSSTNIPLLGLLALFDSGFPTGSFARSNGYESARQFDYVTDRKSLVEFCQSGLQNVSAQHVPIITSIYHAVTRFCSNTSSYCNVDNVLAPREKNVESLFPVSTAIDSCEVVVAAGQTERRGTSDYRETACRSPDTTAGRTLAPEKREVLLEEDEYQRHQQGSTSTGRSNNRVCHFSHGCDSDSHYDSNSDYDSSSDYRAQQFAHLLDAVLDINEWLDATLICNPVEYSASKNQGESLMRTLRQMMNEDNQIVDDQAEFFRIPETVACQLLAVWGNLLEDDTDSASSDEKQQHELQQIRTSPTLPSPPPPSPPPSSSLLPFSDLPYYQNTNDNKEQGCGIERSSKEDFPYHHPVIIQQAPDLGMHQTINEQIKQHLKERLLCHTPPHFSVVTALSSLSVGSQQQQCCVAFLWSHVRNTLSAAVRDNFIGPLGAQRLLAEMFTLWSHQRSRPNRIGSLGPPPDHQKQNLLEHPQTSTRHRNNNHRSEESASLLQTLIQQTGQIDESSTGTCSCSRTHTNARIPHGGAHRHPSCCFLHPSLRVRCPVIEILQSAHTLLYAKLFLS